MAVPDDRLAFSGETSRTESEAAFNWYAATLRHRAQSSWLERVVATVVVIAVLVLGVPFTIIAIQPQDAALAGMLSAVFGFAVAIAFARFTNLRFMRQVQRLRTSNLGRSTYTFGSDGYGIELANGVSSLTPWTAVERVDVTAQYLVFWQDGYAGQIFPRSVTGGPPADAALLAAIRGWTPHLASNL